MIAATLALALAGGPHFAEKAVEGTTLEALHGEAQLAVRVEETRFSAQSAANEPLLLLFAFEDGRPRAARWLARGERIQSDLPRGSTQGMSLEVVRAGGARWSASGAISIEPWRGGGERALWFFASGVVLEGRPGEPIGHARPSGSLVPANLRGILAARSSESGPSLPATAPPPTHVPLPVPSDRPVGDTPPKIEEKPLPPV